MKDSRRLFSAAVVPGLVVLVMWAVQTLSWVFRIDFGVYGVFPRTVFGLVGVATMPLIHGGWEHLWSNTAPLLSLGIGLFFFYPKVALRVFFGLWLFIGLWVWAFARANYHIGASGLVYGLASFLFVRGVLTRNTVSMAIAFFVGIFYGGIWWGVLPIDPGVSWEGHSMGVLAGIVWGYTMRKEAPIYAERKYDLEPSPELMEAYEQYEAQLHGTHTHPLPTPDAVELHPNARPIRLHYLYHDGTAMHVVPIGDGPLRKLPPENASAPTEALNPAKPASDRAHFEALQANHAPEEAQNASPDHNRAE